jgi:hypothetical protein
MLNQLHILTSNIKTPKKYLLFPISMEWKRIRGVEEEPHVIYTSALDGRKWPD